MAVHTVRWLAASCHPLPTVAVTAFATALAGKAGNDIATCAVLAVAVFCGQLSIGWSNDRIDAGRDRRLGRTAKPVASGALRLATVDRAIGVALVATVVASLALGWRPGLVHLAGVGFGWAYNIGIKSTRWSWLPYAAAFAALPATATLARTPPTAPVWWALVAAALLGVAGHFANAFPDLAGDLRTGVLGLPQRVGLRATQLCTAALLLVGTVVLTLGPGPDAVRVGELCGVALLIGGAGVVSRRRPSARWFFAVVVGLVAVDVVLMLVGPSILMR
jgi:4-hydroxybenzoate polyprenyltransferase